MNRLMVVNNKPLRGMYCPICEQWVSPVSVEKALVRGYFRCTGENVRIVTTYVIDELALT